MNNKKLDAAQVWKQMEDLGPRLDLSTTDRVVYSHLLRHSHLEGKPRYQFSIPQLASATGLSRSGANQAVRRLVSVGIVRLVECNSVAGHVVRVRLPEEIRGLRGARLPAPEPGDKSSDGSMEEMNFWQTRPLRRAIHAREGGGCFYCLRRLIEGKRCLDHVVPRAQSGRNSYRNLVSCCLECNSKKGDHSAEEHLRRLYRERRLSDAELSDRLRAVDDLKAGKLVPPLTGEGHSLR